MSINKLNINSIIKLYGRITLNY